MGLYNGETTTTTPLLCSDPDSVDGETSGFGTAINHDYIPLLNYAYIKVKR